MPPAEPWNERYRDALREFLNERSEMALQRAHELGRGAIAGQMGLLDLVALHHRALAGQIRPGRRNGRAPAAVVTDAGAFFVEALSSFEMVHRGFRENVTTLRRINERLEEEARRIAHALHDDAGQLLASVHLALQTVENGAPGRAGKGLRLARSLLDQIENHLRTLSHELRPTMLDDLGLLPALQFLAQSVSARSGLRIRLRSGRIPRLPARVETALYRIVQEALRNAARHAEARQVVVALSIARSQVRCSIRDDGRGFDATAATGNGSRGLGMVGMRDRLDALGGDLVIRSTPGRGTELRITVPLEDHDADTASAR